MKKIELLSPAGDMSKLKTAFYFGADAVYIGGKRFSLRAMAGNFSDEEIIEAVNFAHGLNKKVYVTVNIFGRNADIKETEEYFKFLSKAGVDGVIVSDTGLVYVARTVAPELSVNLSTQANTLNYKTVEFWANHGLKRVILARELSLDEIKEIHKKVPDMELETFIHGAMCISYSGRCLLSDYRTGRSSNRGECVQACRWHYEIREKDSECGYLEMEEDILSKINQYGDHRVKYLVCNTIMGEFNCITFLLDDDEEPIPQDLETDDGVFCYVYNVTDPMLSELGCCFFEKKQDNYYHRVG